MKRFERNRNIETKQVFRRAMGCGGRPAASEKILAFVLADGQGPPQHPLYSKHTLAFSDYPLVDFVLSNLVNSGIISIYLLTQHRPEVLVEHIETHWTIAPSTSGQFISVVLPRYEEDEHFRGSADAVYQNLDLIARHSPDLVSICSVGHIYRMDVRQMVHFHRERSADVTMAATRVPPKQDLPFGRVLTGRKGRILALHAQPHSSVTGLAEAEPVYASMGNYLFNAGVLTDSLEWMAQQGKTDFVSHVLPGLVRSHRVFAYNFASNRAPGHQPHEAQGYWRDVNTVRSYIDTLFDTAGDRPHFCLHNPYWPILPVPALQQPLFDTNFDLVADRISRVRRRRRRSSGEWTGNHPSR